jgi:hypothetical protein
MTIQLVGYATASASGSLSLTSLTGGIGSAPAEDDIVLVAVGGSNSTDQDIAITGYTEVADVYANGTFTDTNLGVFYKIMGGTPDTTVDIPSLSNIRAVVYVLRGVDTTTPMDATATTATKTSSGIPDPPAITTATANAMVVVLSGTSLSGTWTEPSGYSNDVDSGGSFFRVLVASKIIASPGSENPAVWGVGGGDSAFYSCASVTMALRPTGAGATGQIKVWNGSSWVPKPVKVWNGSSWVVKPVKRWNGSSWITTPY